MKPRTNGVTILLDGRAFCTQEPTIEDQKFVVQTKHWAEEFRKENPNGQGQTDS